MSVKIQDVAKRAGVSISTVSRVLNGYAHISDELRGKVEKAIAELEYRPSQAARCLVSQKSNLIGVIVPDLTYQYYAKVISTIEDEAGKNNYSIIICNIKENLEKEAHYIDVLKELWVDGVILLHEKINIETKKKLEECNFSLVLASVKIEGLDVPRVNINDYQAAYDATTYLIDLGHKRIAMIAGDHRDITAGKERLDGYRKALIDANIEVDESIIFEGNFQVNSGYKNMKKILAIDSRPTAVFVASDAMAVGAMNCVMDSGLKVPEDISIMGFDDIDLAQVVRPKLTTIHQPAEEIGQKAMETILKMINKEPFEKEIVLEHKIIERQSCKRI